MTPDLIMAPDLILALAAAQGIAIDRERAERIAATAAPVVAAVAALTPGLAFEAEPDAFRLAQEACAE